MKRKDIIRMAIWMIAYLILVLLAIRYMGNSIAIELFHEFE
jgi:hypothetical protein